MVVGTTGFFEVNVFLSFKLVSKQLLVPNHHLCRVSMSNCLRCRSFQRLCAVKEYLTRKTAINYSSYNKYKQPSCSTLNVARYLSILKKKKQFPSHPLVTASGRRSKKWANTLSIVLGSIPTYLSAPSTG